MNLYHSYNVYPSLNKDNLAFDLRTKEAFHGGHTKGTINIPYNKNFINQIGWYLNYNQPIDLIGDKEILEEAVHTLQLIGFDYVSGYRLPQSLTMTSSIHSSDITGKEQHILDVRTEEEWQNGHLSQAIHIPHGKLMIEDIPFNKEDKIYVHCQSGVRSSIAVGILEDKGFNHIVNVREGYQAFSESVKSK